MQLMHSALYAGFTNDTHAGAIISDNGILVLSLYTTDINKPSDLIVSYVAELWPALQWIC
jgi:hypothetical protein